ncbi:ABC transporter [Catellatospora methionotrophica]|uniref:ABC transporter n=1 Tax=Catellatospora methionotrophica TaxID=121620 RepID=A0A8J3LMN7_9ACTN|nr:FtsX-like permease family protein [Catellatospora methionotrophica]GIG18384.1 ABC transporter [Catellatospora methionotrophica]
MLRATIKSLLARKLRLVLSGLAVLLGVMFVSGSFVLTDALGRSFDNMFSSAMAETDVLVTARPAIDVSEMEGESVPGTLAAADRDAVAAVPGVAEVVADVQADGARVIGKDGKVVASFGPPRFGANWTGETGGLELREGRGPAAADEIAINVTLAELSKLKVGDRVGVLTTQPKKMFTLVGIFGYEGGLPGQGPVHEVRFTEAVAQELMLGAPGAYTSLSVTAAPGTDPAALRDAIQSRLGDRYTVQTGQEAGAAIAGEFKTILSLFNNILLGFAGVALFVGTFLILNTFSIIVAQRTRELALSRALGASRRQVIGSVMVEALAIGLLASVLGLAAGVGVGALLAKFAADFSSIVLASISVPLAAVISAFAVGIGVTVIAALLPAVRASRVPPVAALQEVATPDRPLTRLTVSGAVIGALGAGAIAFGLATTGDAVMWLLLGGVLATFIGVSLLSPVLARPVVSVLGRLFSWSVPGRLGRLNSGRNPRRTAITAAALMVGVALITGVNTTISSADNSLRGDAETGFQADLIISGQESPGVLPTFDEALLPRMRAVPGIGTVTARYADQAMVGEQPNWAAAFTDLPAVVRDLSVVTVAGTLDQPGPGEVVVDDQNAAEAGVAVGGTVTVKLPKGEPTTYRVSGVYQRTPFLGGYLFGTGVVPGMRFPQPSLAYVRLADGADADAARQGLEALLVDSPEMLVEDKQQYLDRVLGEGAQLLLMIQILLGLAIVIAVLGVINTLALSVLERTRELGLLRAIGLSRAATMRMITVEAVVITVFGVLLGVAVGVGLGAAVVQGLADEGLKTLTVPWNAIALYLAAGVALGVLAAALPAIRASRINILTAIAHD